MSFRGYSRANKPVRMPLALTLEADEMFTKAAKILTYVNMSVSFRRTIVLISVMDHAKSKKSKSDNCRLLSAGRFKLSGFIDRKEPHQDDSATSTGAGGIFDIDLDGIA